MFNGKRTNNWVKVKANSIVQRMCDARHGKVKETYVIDGIDDRGSHLIEEFWSYFIGGRPNGIAKEEKMDEKEESEKNVEWSLHQICNLGNRKDIFQMKEVCRVTPGGKNKIDKKLLNSDDVFVLDVDRLMFIWSGKNGSKKKRAKVFPWADKYLREQGRSEYMPMVSVAEGKEPKEFWDAMNGIRVGGRRVKQKKWKK